MTRRLLQELNRRLHAAGSERVADRVRCERAAYLARLGDPQAARRELDEVRARHRAAPAPSLTISVWLHFADALIAHHANLGPVAHDRLSRAHALSAAASLAPMQALCAAWLAHFEHLRGHVEATVRRAGEALDLAAPDDHAALARAKLVIAEAYHEAGRFEQARPWYDAARQHASEAGDDATLAALMWNMAWLRHADLRRRQGLGAALGDATAQQAQLLAESSANFDARIGMGSLRSWQPILRAQILTADGRTGEALALYDTHLEAACADGLGHLDGVLLADRAWCLVGAGRRAEASGAAEEAAGALSRPGAPGDRAPGHSRLAEVHEALHDPAAAVLHRGHATRAWKAQAEVHAALLTALDERFVEHVDL